MKCEKCGYDDKGTGDTAHVCGPVQIKTKPVESVRTIYQFQNKILRLMVEKQKQIAGIEALLKMSSLNESITLLTERQQIIKSLTELTELSHDLFWLIKEDATSPSRSSWEGQVDRQGGSFTAEEMDPNRGWV